jgi:hypothetical protein
MRMSTTMSTSKDTDKPVTDQPISTKKSVKRKYVTHEDLAVFEKSIEGAVNAALEEQFKQVEELVSSKLNASNAEISKALMQHGTAIESIANMIQNGQPQAQPQQNRQQKLDDLIGQVHQIMEIPLVKQKLGIESDPLTAEADALISANWTAAKREFINMQKRSLKKAFTKGLVFPEEVEGLVESAGTKAIEHGI